MKITLDIDQLVAENKISRQEYDKLKELSAQSTSSLAFSILIGFGVVAVSWAALALVPTPYTAIIIGALLLAGGIVLHKTAPIQWNVLAQILIIVGALMLGGGILVADEGSTRAFLGVGVIYAIAALLANSALLTVLSVLSVGPILGTGTGYSHASYMLVVEQPTISIAVFGILGIGLYWLSKIIPLYYSRLSIIAARTCAFMVNFGFWIGSLWGDKFEKAVPPIVISDITFSIVWAIALIAAGIWAWRAHRRWLLNIVAIFGGIHFYTQWFEHLGATPATVLLAGILALVFALAIKYMNTLIVKKL